MKTRLLSFAAIAMTFFVLKGQEQNTEKAFRVYGFIKLNATYDFRDLGGSDLFKPSSIPVPQVNPRNPDFFMSAKQSRVGLEFKKETGIGNVKAVLEVDFHDTATGIGGLARIRHAYLQWKGLTVGQTWSTFYDIQARPHIVDFEGANSSTLNRAPLIRYEFEAGSTGTLALAIENPAEQITLTGDAQAENLNMPDIIAAYKVRWNQDKDFLKFAALVRQLRFSTVDEPTNDETGWGVMLSGKLATFKKDNIKFQAVGGQGIARYIEGVRGLGYDGIFDETTNNLETLGIYGGFISYQIFWGTKWNSSLVLGTTRLEDNELLAENDLKDSNYGSLNLFYEPIKSLSFGLEYLHGKRENIDGNSATANRVQMGAMLKF
ncbi:DcaP family trimeric outer membrane transporter [Allomuricauda sp. d1]|uniref:DcaP family trimeric outer membrane transporter n=1 Tax=Allomuricauda sp. d1 TaxID=3136725 RepID=UPI0031D28F74